VGRIAGYIFPTLDSMEIYRVAGRPVYLPHLIIGLGLTALLITLNYRGIRLSATFQNWTAFGTLALFVVFVALGASRGSPHNFPPLFTHAPLVSFLLVLQIVPYFMTGFESVSKAAEESTREFHSQGYLKAIWMAVLVGILFYTVVIAAVAFVAPWHELTGEKFMTAVAFQRAVGSRWITWQTTSFLVLSLVRKRSCPGATDDESRITAPFASTSTVLVASENGSRLSLPSTVRAPFTVTGTSSATGCALVTSAPLAGISGTRSSFSDEMGSAVLSFSVGGMSYSFAERVSAELCQRRAVVEPFHCSGLARAPAIVPAYYIGNRLAARTGFRRRNEA